jgi:hypothetical protein
MVTHSAILKTFSVSEFQTVYIYLYLGEKKGKTRKADYFKHEEKSTYSLIGLISGSVRK